jgi:hypothetical protein
MNTGIHDLSFSDYLALEAWGSSSLRAMRRGPPARVEWERTARHEDTDATRLGTAVHCALLTPDLYERQYAIKPEGMNFSTKEGKAWRDDPCRAGLTLLSHDVGAQVQAIVEALHAKQAVAESLEDARCESSLVWDCSETGERCKARPDWTSPAFIYDLKVSRHASGGYLALRAFSEGWMHQLAHYRRGAGELGLPITGGRLVVVDPTAPHFVYTLEVKRDALDLLELENIQTLKLLRECRVAGVWPGTPETWTRVDVPASAVMLEESEEIEEVA